MSRALRYDIETRHQETVRGTLVGTPFTFMLQVGNGADSLYLALNNADGEVTQSIEVDGGWISSLHDGFDEIEKLRRAMVLRISGQEPSSLGPE